MKNKQWIVAAVAALALASCNKNKSESTTTTTEKVTITQANPPPGGTWADVVNETSDGYMMGNPNAKVKLVEIGSLGCPVCKKFDDEGVPHVIDLVKTGKLSWEFRPYLIHGPIDMAADLIARCNGPKTFFPLALAMYKDQPVWMGKVEATPQAQLEQMQNLPTNQVFVAFAKLAGLQDWAAARGVPQGKSNQCLTDQKMIDKEVQVSANVNSQYPDFKGTPSFVLNGSLLPDTSSWAKLEPQLKAAVGS
ncbi:MAG TPA: thioredoxin domain-containing protein [Sphingomicrobium sp.]